MGIRKFSRDAQIALLFVFLPVRIKAGFHADGALICSCSLGLNLKHGSQW